MAKFFTFLWTKLKPKEWSFSVSIPFGGPDAGRDLCQYPDCGVMRKVHEKAHAFVEKNS